MSALEIIGLLTCIVAGAVLVLLAYVIAGNIYGGIKGAYRLRKARYYYGRRSRPDPHWQVVKLGLRAWRGKRYSRGRGHFWQIGSLIFPMDGRDPIGHDRIPG